MLLWKRLYDACLLATGTAREDDGGETLQLAMAATIAAILILSLASPIGLGMLGLFHRVLERLPS